MKNRIVAFVIAITMIGASSASAFDLFGGAQKGSTQKGAKRSCSLFGHRGCGKGSVQKGATRKGAAQKSSRGWKRNRGCGCGK